MQTERPRFREDLVAELIEDGGARFIDVADPDSGQMFRFFEVEYSLACAMDGERDVNGIVKWAEEELGLKPSAQEVRTVISTLGSLGYLDSGKAAAAAATEPAAAAVAAAPVETPRPTPVEAEPPARPTPPSRKATPPAGTPKTKTPATGVKKQPEVEKESFNRWDQPTAMGDADEYLDKGVVAGAKRPNTPVADVELGQAGGRVAARGDDLPKSDDMELGAPGVSTPAAAAKSAGKAADVQLGNAGAAGVSTDLAADMAISPADVKAAVRASQVMKAADVPPELAAELEPAKPIETKPAAKQPEAKPAAKQPEAKPAAKQPEAKPVAKQPEPQPEKKPIQMPTERPVLPQAPPAPGPNKFLIALLVIVALGGIGFAVWKFVLSKKTDSTASTQKQPTPPPPQPTPPPPPPVETAKLAAETSPPEEIKPAAAVQIATIIATDSEVKEGDTIAKLVGFKPSGDKVAMYEKELGILKGQLADAEKARDAAPNDAAKKPHETKIIGLNKMIPDREAKLAAAKTDLEKFLIKSPGAGKVTVVAKANAKVTPTDIVATLQRAPVMVATFKTAPDATADAKVLLATKEGDKKLSCKVVATGGDGTKIACPADAAPEGTEVTYAGLDTSTPTEAPAEGSAAPAEGSAAPTEGSAAPTEGSAAAPAEGSAAAPAAEDKGAEKAPAPKAQPRRPAPKKAPATEEKPANEKLFPPASTPPAEPAPAPATP